MPADLAFELLGARRYRMEQQAAANGGGAAGVGHHYDGVADGARRTNPDGTVSVRIGSMDSLRSLLAAPLTG